MVINSKISGRYAKSLLDLAIEKGELESVKQDVELFRKAIGENPDLKSVLQSPIVKSDRKLAILKAISKDRVGEIVQAFNRLVVNKNRENGLPEIFNAFVDQYNKYRGIHRVKITTAQPLSDATRKMLLEKVKVEAGIEHIELTEKVDEAIIGGFIIEYDNKLIDGSISRDLRDVARQFQRNDYIYKIR